MRTIGLSIKKKLELLFCNKPNLVCDIKIHTNNSEEQGYMNYVKHIIIDKGLPNCYDSKTYKEVLLKKTERFDNYFNLLIKEVRLEKIRLLKNANNTTKN